jgi:C-terminal processing protease CtpA/Prc
MKKIGFITLIILLISLKVNSQNENNLSTEDKLFGLSKLWKEASYNFAFFDQVPNLNWDSCFQAYIPFVTDTKSDWEYYLVLQKFFALLKDGHTKVFPPATLRIKYYASAITQIKTQLIQGKVIITEVLSDSIQSLGIKKGMEILTIDNIEVHQYAGKYVAPYMTASTPQDLSYQTYGLFLLNGSIISPAVIKTKDFDGTTKEFSIHRKPWLREEDVFRGEAMAYKELENNIGYLKINMFTGGESFKTKFDSIYTKILHTEGLIIDVRNNFGGSTQIGHYVLKHLTNENFRAVNWKSPMVVAAHKSWGKNKDWFEQEGEEISPFKDKPIYTKSIHVIVDESTFSGAEDFCVGFTTMKRGKLLGRKTAGSTGNPLIIELPGGGFAKICTKRDVFPDGKEFVGYGITPDIEVDRTIADIRNDNDAALNVALKNLSGN